MLSAGVDAKSKKAATRRGSISPATRSWSSSNLNPTISGDLEKNQAMPIEFANSSRPESGSPFASASRMLGGRSKVNATAGSAFTLLTIPSSAS